MVEQEAGREVEKKKLFDLEHFREDRALRDQEIVILNRKAKPGALESETHETFAAKVRGQNSEVRSEQR